MLWTSPPPSQCYPAYHQSRVSHILRAVFVISKLKFLMIREIDDFSVFWWPLSHYSHSVKKYRLWSHDVCEKIELWIFTSLTAQLQSSVKIWIIVVITNQRLLCSHAINLSVRLPITSQSYIDSYFEILARSSCFVGYQFYLDTTNMEPADHFCLMNRACKWGSPYKLPWWNWQCGYIWTK